MVIFLAILLLEFGAALMLAVELQDPDSNIKNASDALWYTYVTVTTVGSGDRYPVTNAGRLVGVLIMTVVVGLFGTLTGFLANAFVSLAKESTGGATAGDSDDDIRTELADIRQLLKSLEERDAASSATGNRDGRD